MIAMMFGLSQIGFGQNLEHECILLDSANIEVMKYDSKINNVDSLVIQTLAEFISGRVNWIKGDHIGWESVKSDDWDIVKYQRLSKGKIEKVELLVDGIGFVMHFIYIINEDKPENDFVAYKKILGARSDGTYIIEKPIDMETINKLMGK